MVGARGEEDHALREAAHLFETEHARVEGGRAIEIPHLQHHVPHPFDLHRFPLWARLMNRSLPMIT